MVGVRSPFMPLVGSEVNQQVVHRQPILESFFFGETLKGLFPIIQTGVTDSASFDNALEFLVQGGRSLPYALTMLIPEAVGSDPVMDEQKRAFYEYHSALMEPWDGPAVERVQRAVSGQRYQR